MPSGSRASKLSSAFAALTSGSTRKLRRRPRLALIVIGLVALLSAGMFIAVLIEDRQLQGETMHRDIDSAALQLGTRLFTLSETMSAIARDIGNGSLTDKRFAAMAQDLVTAKQELARIEYVNAEGLPVWPAVVAPAAGAPPVAATKAGEAEPTADPVLKPVLTRVAQGFEPVYVPLASGPRGAPLVLAVPVYINHEFAGALIARIDLIEFMAKGVPGETLDRYRLTIALGERLLASTSASAPPADALTYDVPLTPLPTDYRLQSSAFRLQSRFTTSSLVWVDAALAIAVLAALAVLARFTRHQQRIDRALLSEAALRRAMEDSLATAVRVVDSQGVICYVNRGFCQMTGFVQRDLIGCAPPYPYWPPDDRAANEAALRQLLAGKALPGAVEEAVQRKDGTRFTASLYSSPLLDESTRHIGWITSMVDVTESALARDELAAARDRLSSVVESIEAAVSAVVDRPDGSGSEIVFANRAYVSQFGAGAAGHVRLAAQLRGREAGEVHDKTTGRSFDVRMRDVRWPTKDKRGEVIARLQLATDVATRKVADVEQQQDPGQFASRLITIEQMASSLAHELSQPLSAITSHSESTLARLKERQISIDELQSALEKTTSQAHRARGIVERLREFVKRSGPRRRATPPQRVVEDAIGATEIEAGRKGITIAANIDPTLEPLLVDPVPIKQVLRHLLQNAIDAMEDAALRRVDVVVRRSLLDGMAEFAVIDRGCGIPEENLASLFEPFFSTKADGVGMGLGICRSIIESHDGRLTVEKNPERAGGTIMRFTLPLAGASVVEHGS